MRPGIITDQDWWNYTSEGMKALWPFPSAFNFASGIGADWRTNINYFPMEALVGGLGRTGLDVGTAERIAVIFPAILIAPIAAFVLAKQYLRSNAAAFAAALFYANNAYIDVIVGRGQLTIAQSYALVPLAAAFAVLAVRKPARTIFAIAAAVSLAWALVCDVRIGLLGFAVIAVLVLAELRRENLFGALRSGLYWALGLALLLCFVWLPIVALHIQEKPPLNYTDPAWLGKLSQSGPLDLLTSFKPLWFDNQIHAGPFFFLLFFPLLVIALVCGARALGRRRYAALLAIYVISAVLAIGANSPFGPVYAWLFDHTWFFAMFRDPSKFYAPAMLAFALFMGVAVDWIRTALATRSRISRALCAAVCVLCVLPSSPVADGAQHQLYDPKTWSPSEKRLSAILDADPTFSRVLWGVSPDRLVPGDERHPQVDGLWFAGVRSNGKSVYSSARALLMALHAFGIRYVVLRRDKAAGLQYAPALQVYRTLELLAQQNVFGKPMWDDRAFRVYRLNNVVAAFPARSVPHYAIYQDEGRLRLKAHTLLSADGARRVMQTPRVTPLSIARTRGGVNAPLPDWTGDVMLKISAPAGAPSRRAAVLLTGTSGAQRFHVTIAAPQSYVTLPATGLGRAVSIRLRRANGARIEAAYGIDAAYADLIDPSAIARAQRTQALPLLVPISSIAPHTAYSHGVPLRAQAAPAKFSFVLPRTAAMREYWIPLGDTALWRISGGTRIADTARGTLPAPLRIRTAGGPIVLTCAADLLLRVGAAVSAAALAILLVCIALLLAASLRHAGERKTIRAEIVHT